MKTASREERFSRESELKLLAPGLWQLYWAILSPRVPLEVWLCNWSSSSPKAKKARRMEIASAPGRGGERARGAKISANHSGQPCAHVTPMCAPYTALATWVSRFPHGGLSSPCYGNGGSKCVVLRCRAGCRMACSSETKGARRPIKM